MAGDVLTYNPVVKELVTLAAGDYTGDTFEIGDDTIKRYLTSFVNFQESS